jgi:hypothetical protein
MVAGGTTGPLLYGLSVQDGRWGARDIDPSFTAPIVGTYMASSYEVYLVGSHGESAVYNGGVFWIQPSGVDRSIDLVAVSGRDGLLFAVGGTPADRSITQTGCVYLRGQTFDTYTVDGATFTAFGNVRQDFGGGERLQ